LSGNVDNYIAPFERLKIVKQVVPNAFEKGVRTARFHVDVLEMLEKRSRFTALAIFRGASKSTIFNKFYVATEVFYNHEPYVQVVSKDHDKATKFTKDIRKIFEAMLKMGYSVVRGDSWRDDYFEVIIDGVHKCVIEAIGAGEDPRGATADFMRPTLILIDDLESKLGRYPIGNKKHREKLASWFDDDLLPGLHPSRGRVIFMGTILHKDSLLARCLRDSEWLQINIPIMRDGKSAWKSRFSRELINFIKERYRKRGKLSGFYREYMNKAVADEKILFKEQYFKYFSHVEFEGVGEQRSLENAKKSIIINVQKPIYIVFQDGTKLDLSACTIYTTMDVASGSDSGDRSAIVTCAYDGINRYVLEIKSGYWDPFEKGVKAIETYLTYKPLFFGIEKGGMQNDFHSSIEVTQAEAKVDIPVEPLNHNKVNKNIRIANMQPGFIAGRNWFNASDTNTTELEAQLNEFDVESDSAEDDEMDALAYQEQYFSGNMDDGLDEYDEEDEGGLYN
jgi:hypothetical protein